MPLIIKVISLNENCEKVSFAKICRLACFVERTTSHLEWAGKKLNNAVFRKCEDRDRWRDAVQFTDHVAPLRSTL